MAGEVRGDVPKVTQYTLYYGDICIYFGCQVNGNSCQLTCPMDTLTRWAVTTLMVIEISGEQMV